MTGRQFGHYELESLVGVGGMGEVWRATDTRRDRTVALKLLPEALGNDADFINRFRRESHVAARLREPHVVPIHDYGEIDGRLFIDMRLVDGRDLGVILKDGPIAPARAVALMSQVADALEAAHADGLVHRDIKPSNVLVTANDFVYVVDFGIARSIGSTRTSLTMTGATVGTLDYMAPERFTNQPLDGRVDVYSLACVLAECLTATRPFPGEDLASLLYAHLYTDPPRPSSMVPGIPPALDDVISRGMAKRPEDRYDTPCELVTAARAALDGAGGVPAPRSPHAAGRGAGRPARSPAHAGPGGGRAALGGRAPLDRPAAGTAGPRPDRTVRPDRAGKVHRRVRVANGRRRAGVARSAGRSRVAAAPGGAGPERHVESRPAAGTGGRAGARPGGRGPDVPALARRQRPHGRQRRRRRRRPARRRPPRGSPCRRAAHPPRRRRSPRRASRCRPSSVTPCR